MTSDRPSMTVIAPSAWTAFSSSPMNSGFPPARATAVIRLVPGSVAVSCATRAATRRVETTDAEVTRVRCVQQQVEQPV